MPEWLKVVIGPTVEAVIAIGSACATIFLWGRSVTSRVAKLEQQVAFASSDDTLQQFREDLKTHQEEDCQRLDALHEQSSQIKSTVDTTANDVKWIKETLTKETREVNDRITEHERRNREHVKALTDALAKVSETVAVLKDSSPKRRPTR